MRAPETISTERMLLRKPEFSDADAIFERYASDPDVCHFLGWPRHRSVEDTRAFLEFSDHEWQRWPAGPFLLFSQEDQTLLGGTGLGFEVPYRASTGYVLAKDSWGHGYATEALIAMRDLAPQLGVARLYAACHPEHIASIRVLEKGGFEREGILRRFHEFPNLDPGNPQDAVWYSWTGG